MKPVRRKTKTLAAGAGVALATTGLSTCNNNGAVDPPPPPSVGCATDVASGLSATATLSGLDLTVTIRKAAPGTWQAAFLTSVTGGAFRDITSRDPLVLRITLTDASVMAGAFSFNGRLDQNGIVCSLERTFRFTIQAGAVTVASADDLALPIRQQARIGLVERDGNEVVLEASTPFAGPQTVSWTVTGGEMLAQDGHRMRWRLPAEAGFYQAELVIDYGSLGLSFDALALEVT